MVIVRPENEHIVSWFTKPVIILLSIGIAVTAVVGFFYFSFIHNLRDFSSDPTIRSIQFGFYQKTRGWDETDVVKQIIAERLSENSFFPDEVTTQNDGVFFQYFDKENKPLGMYSIVGLITAWVPEKYYLEVTDRNGKKYYFNLVPTADKPIYESYKILQQQTRQKELAHTFCAWKDIAEVIWSDTEEVSFIRPDEIKFVYRPEECWKY